MESYISEQKKKAKQMYCVKNLKQEGSGVVVLAAKILDSCRWTVKKH